MKWESCRKAHGEIKYVICNADEGDPGAYMDRSLLEGNPHSVLEGMIIGAFAIGSHEGYVYVRNEYPLAVINIGSPFSRQERWGFWERTSSVPGLILMSRSAAEAGPLSAANLRAWPRRLAGMWGNRGRNTSTWWKAALRIDPPI